MPRPAANKARDTRGILLEAALELLAERGFHGASMRAIAAAADVRESALYHYFPSKESLLAAAIAEAPPPPAPSAEELRQLAAAPLEDALAWLVERVASLFESARDRRLLRATLSAGAPLAGAGPPWRALLDRPRRIVAPAFRELRRAGRLRDDVEMDAFLVELVAPLLVAGNLLAPRGATAAGIRRFLRQHVALLARGTAAGRRAR
jgi:AcrR family transcriptional regulator